jgi:hypothetical protein
MEETPAGPGKQTVEDKVNHRLQWLTRRRLLFFVVLLATIVNFQYDIRRQPVRGDRANWEYFAQVIARGGAPYRDVVNIKSPLSAYIGAAAIVATRPLGVRDIWAVRVTYILLGIIIVALVFLVAMEYFDSRATAALAALVMMAFNSFSVSNSAGIQPKTPMILFGLAALWAIRKDRPFAAGAFSMLSALSWQPGLMFFGVAWLAFSRYLTRWRERRLLLLICGTALPLVLLLAHLWMAGAVRDFYLWTFDFNLNVYAPGEMKPLSRFFTFLERMMNHYRADRIFLRLSMMGILFWLGTEIWRAARSGIGHLLDRAPFHAVALPPIIYLAFCMINVQGTGDTYPFLPYIALFSAFVIIAALWRGVDLALLIKKASPFPVTVRTASFAALCTLVFFFHVKDAFSYRRRGLILKDQEKVMREITSHLEPGDRVFVHGPTEILVLADLTNMSKYFFLDRGKDHYLDKVEEGGFDGWFARLKAERPKIVGMTRLKKVDRKQDFKAWLDAEYEERPGKVIIYYVRKDAVAPLAETKGE